MKNNYNPYTVPDGFFEAAQNQALSGFQKRRRAFLYGAAAFVAIALLVVPMFINTSNSNLNGSNEALASMYEYDIFLQVNF